jgi:hypothetical protein
LAEHIPKASALLARCQALIDEENAEQHFARAIDLAIELPSFRGGT